jgi:hypothetical protein
VDTLISTCVSVLEGVSKHHLPSENATMTLYAQSFLAALTQLVHHAVFRSWISSYSVGVR